MAFTWLKSLLSSCRKEEKTGPEQEQQDRNFAILSNRFRMFLTAWNRFQEIESQIEYTLCCEHPFGIYKVRALCTDVALQVFQCVRQLKALDGRHTDELVKRFSVLQKEVSSLVYDLHRRIQGPLILPLNSPELASSTLLASPEAVRLSTLPDKYRALVPRGFMITGAGCDLLLGEKKIREEINRRIQSEGGLKTKRVLRLGIGAEQVVRETPMPQELQDAVRAALHELREECRDSGPMLLVFKVRLWPPESKYESDGLYMCPEALPLSSPDEEILEAVHRALSLKQCAQALVYRRARGLTGSGTGFSVSCIAMESGSKRGVVKTAHPLQPEGSLLQVYVFHGHPREKKDSDRFSVSPNPPYAVRVTRESANFSESLDKATVSRVAGIAADLAADKGCPQSMSYFVTPDGRIYIHTLHDLLLRQRAATPVMKKEEGTGLRGPEEKHYAEDELLDKLPDPILSGGMTANQGVAAGHPVIARKWNDLRNFPPHAVLVVPDDHYLWVSALDSVSALIVEKGRMSSRLADICREFRIPTIFQLPGAMEKLKDLEWVTVSASDGCVYAGLQDVLAAQAVRPIDYMPTSPVYRILDKASKYISPLTVDPQSLDFTAANCRTYRDIAVYCHAKALDAMFALGAEQTGTELRVRQLYDQVPKQFWVINLGGGFAPITHKGPLIDIRDITSVPMQSFWHGMNAYDWEGPPPVDGKGFLSVLFEATTNPNLEPSAQTQYFTEKNYFLVSGIYMSMFARFGFHFISVEARVSERRGENYVSFTLRGGAADIERRVSRVNFVGDLLWEFGFKPDIRGDSLTARLEGMSLEEGRALLTVAGHLTTHTRQLDMIMLDKEQRARKKEEILEQCRALYTGRR